MSVDTPEPEVLISMIQHYLYCPRQWALIHVEQTFQENVLTLGGKHIHEKVHEAQGHTVGETRVERALPVWSRQHGIHGLADLVEFRADGPYPVEYKHGRKTQRRADEAQLCAQALCLEEMFQAEVPRGAIYHHSSHARREVEFEPALRRATLKTIKEIRRALQSSSVAPPPADSRCTNCSLNDLCMPELAANQPTIRTELERLFVPDPDS